MLTRPVEKISITIETISYWPIFRTRRFGYDVTVRTSFVPIDSWGGEGASQCHLQSINAFHITLALRHCHIKIRQNQPVSTHNKNGIIG